MSGNLREWLHQHLSLAMIREWNAASIFIGLCANLIRS